MSDNSKDDKTKSIRVCHVIKRDDFDGYGFNLHAEKGKPGQYIGKVDDNSPASEAGLRECDRIIEVNGINIGNETHKQVVQRIKAIAHEVRLLVVDQEVQVTKDNQIIQVLLNNNLKENDELDSDKNVPGSPNKSIKSINSATSSNNSITQENGIIKSENKVTKDQNGTKEPPAPPKRQQQPSIPPPPVPTILNSSISSTSSTSTSSTAAASSTTQSNGNSKTLNHNNINNFNNNNNINNNNNSSNNNNVENIDKKMNQIDLGNQNLDNKQTIKQESNHDGLKLPMTAAEMRAKLAAKKKFNPKAESVDLKLKYDIIQKL